MHRLPVSWRMRGACGLALGLSLSCTGNDTTVGDGPSECIGGELCVGDLICVDGFCVDPNAESGELAESGESAESDESGDTGETGDPEGFCGDGVVDPGEACDDGNDVDDDACSNDCSLASCGDGAVDMGEDCDDGNDDNTDACLVNCLSASCGDGYIYTDVETCDDGNGVDTDACLSSCEAASCGDGYVQAGVEDCDDGNADDTDACVDGCVPAACGDGYFYMGVEGCDDGNANNTDTCLDDCVAASCGDSYVGPGEACDDGNLIDNDACSNACALASCGDAQVQQGEDCDDGNANNTDACLDTCVDASCGDAFVWAGEEPCDDGNVFNADACLVGCFLASCGDGYIWVGQESCDDGNANNYDDNCTSICEFPSCGDGYVQFNEECDEGNANGDDAACLSTCDDAICGDDLVWDGVEQCDDGNNVANDGCEPDCDRSQIHSINAGADFTCILFGAGKVRCWGSNSQGQVGRLDGGGPVGNSPQSMPPLDVPLGGNVVQLATGYSHACALLENGSVVCWGSNDSGQLGIGSTEDIGEDPNDLPPQQINGLGTVVQVATSADSTCVLLDTGGMRCWGSGGYNTGVHKGDDPGEMPTPLVSIGGSVAELAAHGVSNYARMVSNNELRCWGSNGEGQCGQGHIFTIGVSVNSMPPQSTNYGLGVLTDVFPGIWHICVRFDDSDLRCWGRNTNGQLGIGSTNHIGDVPGEMPPGNTNVGGLVVTAASGGRHTCAIINGGAVRCWGNNQYGQLGYQTGNNVNIGDAPNEMPPSNALVPLGAVALALGDDYTCALYPDNAVRCWGYAVNGRLGNGTNVSTSSDWSTMPPDPINVF
jgi:cysteine-rich repeat protein